MYLNFVFLDQFLFESSCRNINKNTETHRDAHKDSDQYSIDVFCKNATLINLQCNIHWKVKEQLQFSTEETSITLLIQVNQKTLQYDVIHS